MATEKKTILTKPTDRELVFTRVFDAPRELVFEAWTEPKHLEAWWGPNGFRTESLSMDLRPGGIWRLIMHGPDGREYRNRTVYSEIVAPERLVYQHGSEDGTVRIGSNDDLRGDKRGVNARDDADVIRIGCGIGGHCEDVWGGQGRSADVGAVG